MLNFKKYLEQNTIGYHNDGPGGAFVSSDFSGSENPQTNFEGRPLHLPSTDLGMPSVTKTSQISKLERNKNPIFVLLKDGTKLYFTYDEFNRISGEPAVGKTITVVFQRHPGDKSATPSKVSRVTVH